MQGRAYVNFVGLCSDTITLITKQILLFQDRVFLDIQILKDANVISFADVIFVSEEYSLSLTKVLKPHQKKVVIKAMNSVTVDEKSTAIYLKNPLSEVAIRQAMEALFHEQLILTPKLNISVLSENSFNDLDEMSFHSSTELDTIFLEEYDDDVDNYRFVKAGIEDFVEVLSDEAILHENQRSSIPETIYNNSAFDISSYPQKSKEQSESLSSLSLKVDNIVQVETSDVSLFESIVATEIEVSSQHGASLTDKASPIDIQEKKPEPDWLELQREATRKVMPSEQYWLNANTIFYDGKWLFTLLPKNKIVYSSLQPAQWIEYIGKPDLRCLSVDEKIFSEPEQLTSYPLASFHWIRVLLTETKSLHKDLKLSDNFQITRWPAFNLLYLDNTLLRLCALLFVQPHSVNDLIDKTEYKRSLVIGVINACYHSGFLEILPNFIMEKELILKQKPRFFSKIRQYIKENMANG